MHVDGAHADDDDTSSLIGSHTCSRGLLSPRSLYNQQQLQLQQQQQQKLARETYSPKRYGIPDIFQYILTPYWHLKGIGDFFNGSRAVCLVVFWWHRVVDSGGREAEARGSGGREVDSG